MSSPSAASAILHRLPPLVPPRRARALLLFALAGFASAPARAQDATSARPQLAHHFWGVEDGAPDEVVALAQTADGYLWLGTASGLYRFDGMRFERYRPISGPDLLSANVLALFAPANGGLWIGYRFGGFSLLSQGRLTNFAGDAATTGGVLGFAQDRDGVVWAATTSGVWRLAGSQWEHLGPEWNSPAATVHLGIDRAGFLWARDPKRLL